MSDVREAWQERTLPRHKNGECQHKECDQNTPQIEKCSTFEQESGEVAKRYLGAFLGPEVADEKSGYQEEALGGRYPKSALTCEILQRAWPKLQVIQNDDTNKKAS